MTREPVRTEAAAERICIQGASAPYVAWRDASGGLQVHELSRRAPATIGRVNGIVTFPGERLISRSHAEVTLRVYTDPDAVCVFLHDSGSKHGTEHRTALLRHGRTVEVGPWHSAPHPPARPVRLDAGDHDVRLAGELYVLIGGVPLDEGSTSDRDTVPEPTARQRDVLVELCRPFFAAPGTITATPSNAEIAARLTPPITPDRVSDLLSEMYRRYELHGTKEQNRVELVGLASRYLIDAGDYG